MKIYEAAMNLWKFGVPRIMYCSLGEFIGASKPRQVGAAPGEVVGTSTSSNQKSSEEGKVKNLGSESGDFQGAGWLYPSSFMCCMNYGGAKGLNGVSHHEKSDDLPPHWAQETIVQRGGKGQGKREGAF